MPAPNLPLIPVSLASIAMESLFYGIFLTLSITSITLTVSRNISSSSINSRNSQKDLSFLFRPMFIGTAVVFLAVTGHWIVNVIRLFDAFAYGQGGAGGPIAYYAALSTTAYVAKTGLLIIGVVASDLMITYRAWIIWNHNYYAIIFPLCCVMGLIVCGIGITYQFSIYVPGAPVFESVAGRWITSDTVFTAVTNIYCTAAIMWKVWHTNKSMAGVRHGGVNMMELVEILVESAALYAAWSVIFLATYEAESNFQFFMVDTIPVIAGIAFMLINVRVGLGRSMLFQPKINSTTNGSTANAPSAPIRLRPMTVNVAQVVQRDDDGERYGDVDSYYQQKPITSEV